MSHPFQRMATLSASRAGRCVTTARKELVNVKDLLITVCLFCCSRNCQLPTIAAQKQSNTDRLASKFFSCHAPDSAKAPWLHAEGVQGCIHHLILHDNGTFEGLGGEDVLRVQWRMTGYKWVR